MRAWVLDRPAPVERAPLRRADLPLPEPGRGELRLRVLACGVCHTDLHEVEGDLPMRRSPLVPGHQIVGVVEARGPGCHLRRVGERVGATWLHAACGACERCAAGRENLCAKASFNGYDHDGGYAEACVLPEGYVYPLPPGIDDLQAAPLLCAGVIGYRSLRLSEIRPGQRLGLFGFGASAHIGIQIARHWGCEVFVFTRSEGHREHARELGAAWTGGPDEESPAPLDAAVSFAPVGEIVPRALAALGPGGTLAINAVHLTPIPALPYERLYLERTVRSVAHCTRRDAVELLELAASIPIRTDVEGYDLDEANAVLRRLKASEVRGAAVLRIST